ncbi:MAG: TIGR04438 family Trp-rich protein [Roseateles asaccharophilus]|jgi:small Trp-rich protein|uniref:Small Trp-rich protein n=1 Tax=Roseateles asaccharophilus TaxID=582607 RepID=A0A4R6N989_9BURK|nr:TIGR04438 family Trp-rich protein [Roseateles asaccharophilus]MDN3543697.1 TIGR04438 family Trp-rich protein [Roseateles asaccharophilus]TDP11925.1 small Trp-rich protein [Roseateles asaccharophilus]
MGFVLIGVLLLLLKWQEVAPVAGWSWWLVLSPFAAAVLWWAWADASGYTQKRAMRSLDEKKAQRRERTLEALGQGEKQRRR